MKQKSDHLKLVENKDRVPAWKRLLRFMTKLALLAGFALLLWQAEAYFRVGEIRVEGAEELDRNEILEAGGISKEMSIFLLREGDAAARIKKELPRAEQVEIKRELPGTVVIAISERQPAGYVMTADGFWLIDSSGVSMAYTDDPKKGYPLISGIEGLKVIPGALIDCPASLEALQNFFSNWSGEGGLEIEQLDLQDSYNLIAYTTGGLEIWFGEGKDMDSKLLLIEKSLPYIDPASEARLDVRGGKRLIVSGSAVIKEEEKGVDP